MGGIRLRYIEGGKEKFKSKATLLTEIVGKIEERKEFLQSDWMERVDNGRKIYKGNIFNPSTHYSRTQIVERAEAFGITDTSHKNIGKIRAEIQGKYLGVRREEK